MDIPAWIAKAELMAQNHPLLLVGGAVVFVLFVVIGGVKLRQDAKTSPQVSRQTDPQMDANGLQKTPEIDDAPDREKVMQFRIETYDVAPESTPKES